MLSSRVVLDARGRIQKDSHGGNHDAKLECKCVRTLVFLNAVATVAIGGGERRGPRDGIQREF